MRVLRVAGAVLLALLVLAGAFLGVTWYGTPWSIDHYFLRQGAVFLLEHPMLLSYARVLDGVGLDFYSDELEDYSVEASERDFALASETLAGLDAYPDETLSREQRRSKAVLGWFLARTAEQVRFLHHGYVVNQFQGAQSFLPDFMLNVHQIDDGGDVEEYLARLAGFDVALDQMRARVTAAAERGIVPPSFVISEVREAIASFARPEAEQSPLYAKLERRLPELGLAEARSQDALARARTILQDEIAPAYGRMETDLAALETRATRDAGAWKHPEGDAYYRWALRYHTTTSLSPDEVHRIGLEEVSRIQGEMRSILDAEGLPSMDVVASLRRLSEDPAHLYPDDDEGRARILADYQSIIDEVMPKLRSLFGRLPEAPVRVERVPIFKEGGSAGAYYNPPSLDGSRPGVFYANLANLSETVRWGMRTLTYHEAVPGHHFQIATAMENDELPLFRRFLPFTAFIEGWALYAERLAAEEGLHPTALDHLGQLKAELFRAVRLVVDTGIHAKRWTREQAIEYMVENAGTIRSDAVREVERYVVAPGQACAYKIGQLEILALRARARAALGDRFDLVAFHDTILGGGAMPLEVLSDVVDDWIGSRLGDGRES